MPTPIIEQDEADVKRFPVVVPRVLTADECADMNFFVSRQAQTDAFTYDVVESELSLNDMAAIAIGLGMVSVFKAAFEIPKSQYGPLVWEYVDTLRLYTTRGRR